MILYHLFLISTSRGFTNTYHHTALLSLDGVNDKEGSKFYLGKKIAYIYKAQKAVAGSKFRVVWGKVMRPHGTNGVVRAKFATNLPVSLCLVPFFINGISNNLISIYLMLAFMTCPLSHFFTHSCSPPPSAPVLE